MFESISKLLVNWIDVEIYHLETAQHLEFSNVSVVTQGPLRAAVRAEVKYGQSTISITVTCFVLVEVCLGCLMKMLEKRFPWMPRLVSFFYMVWKPISLTLCYSYCQGEFSIAV